MMISKRIIRKGTDWLVYSFQQVIGRACLLINSPVDLNQYGDDVETFAQRALPPESGLGADFLGIHIQGLADSTLHINA